MRKIDYDDLLSTWELTELGERFADDAYGCVTWLDSAPEQREGENPPGNLDGGEAGEAGGTWEPREPELPEESNCIVCGGLGYRITEPTALGEARAGACPHCKGTGKMRWGTKERELLESPCRQAGETT